MWELLLQGDGRSFSSSQAHSSLVLSQASEKNKRDMSITISNRSMCVSECVCGGWGSYYGTVHLTSSSVLSLISNATGVKKGCCRRVS